MRLLAKDPKREGTSLLDHTRDVILAATTFAKAWGLDVERARYGALLHDLGKGHPFFQSRIHGALSHSDMMLTLPHRHEISSLLFLPLVPRRVWPEVVEMIVAHHKSLKYDVGERGLLDLVELDGRDQVFERHAEGWEDWAPIVCKEISELLPGAKAPERADARVAFDFALDYCRKAPRGWSRWRGLLMAADHFASDQHAFQAIELDRLFEPPNLAVFDRPHPLYPFSRISADDPRPHTLVIGPTGSGKTDILLRRGRGRVFYVLPFQASINAMALRIDSMLRQAGFPTDVRRLHAASRIRLSRHDLEETALQRHPGAAIKVLTPHQLATIAFAAKGFEALSLDLEGADLILDEIHVYSGVTQSVVIEIVRALVELDCRIHLGSATMPTALTEELLEILGGEDTVQKIELSPETLDTFDRHRVFRIPDEEVAREIIHQALSNGERVLFVSNQVARAQDRFEWARDEFPAIPVMLIHSRYRRRDRAELENLILEFEEMGGPCLVCTTQVIEVSLDISFDRMVTDPAPLDALAQRFGRIHRRRTVDTIGTYRPVHVIAPSERARDLLPYDREVVRTSYDLLPDGGVLRERHLQELLDQVYPEVTAPPMYAHFARGPKGFRWTTLCHQPRSSMLDALEIESASCVLESDVEEYLHGAGDRHELEIPVPISTLIRFREWQQLELGSRPLIAPDYLYDLDPDTWLGRGLLLPTPDQDSPSNPNTRMI